MAGSDPSISAGQRLEARTRHWLGQALSAAEASALLVALIWVVQGINVLDHYGLDQRFGIVSRVPSDLPYILTAPFLHVSMNHIESNTLPLAVLAFAAALGGFSRFCYATAIVVVVGGLGTWLFSPGRTVTVGASGLIFGYLGYVVTRGLFSRSAWQIVLGVAVFAYYYWSLALLFPTSSVRAMHISWQGHLCGFIAGILAAYLTRRRRVARPREAEFEPAAIRSV
jgi:membrane associated rhomboid family serine protease